MIRFLFRTLGSSTCRIKSKSLSIYISPPLSASSLEMDLSVKTFSALHQAIQNLLSQEKLCLLKYCLDLDQSTHALQSD